MEKKLEQRVRQLEQQYPEAEIQLWAFDEHRLGLKPLLRRIWVQWWETPTAEVNWKFEWLWVYGFVEPQSGQTYWWLIPRVNTAWFNEVLANFARFLGLGNNKQILLVLDQARWHTSKKVELPPGIHLEFLPSYSPELQPAERLWPLTNEPVVNRCFDSIESLEEVVASRCRALGKIPELIRGLTCYHWWPQTRFCTN